MATEEIATSVTQRGQVTIPAKVRRMLGAKPRQKVIFRIEGGQVRLLPARHTLETVYGSVTPQRHPEDFKEIARRAKEEHAAHVQREMQQR